MKKLLVATAATLLLSAGAASAAATNVTISLFGYSCTVAVSKLSDSADGVGKVLLAATGSGCGFTGAGDIGKVKGLGNSATIVGTSSLLGDADKIEVILNYPFVTGGTYYAYYTSDGKTLTFINKGTYTVGN